MDAPPVLGVLERLEALASGEMSVQCAGEVIRGVAVVHGRAEVVHARALAVFARGNGARVEGATDTTEVPRHEGAGRMTQAEGHFESSPAPRVFQRKQWTCEKCGASGWAWVEAGAELRMDRCPHRRPGTVRPRGNVRAAS